MTNPYMHGEELKPLQERLRAARLYGGKIDGVFGPATGRACKGAKWKLGYPADACVKTGGQTLLNYLNGTTHLPPDYINRRAERGYATENDEQQLRQKIVANAKWGVNNAAQIHYQQSRPMDGHHHPRKLPLWTDCSGFVTDCYEWAGAKVDPNGHHFNGLGYTGDMLIHGLTVPLWTAEIADLVVWGSFPGHHVAMIMDLTNKSDPLLASHGSERGPLAVRLSAETAVQQRSYVIKKYI